MRPLAGIALAMTMAMACAGTATAGINSWSATGPSGASVSAVKYLPGPGTVVLAVTRFGIYRSTDEGAHWTPVQRFALPANQHLRCAIAVNPQNSNQVLVVTQSLYRSTDRGLTWTETPVAGATGDALRGRCVAFNRDGSAGWLAATQSRMFRSGDGGATWTLRNNGFPQISALTFDKIEVDAANAAIVYAMAGGILYRTLDDGANWSIAGSFMPNMHDLTASPFTGGMVLRAATFPGQATERSTDHGDSWLPSLNAVLYNFRFSSTTPGRVIAQDNAHYLHITENDGQDWSVRALLPTASNSDFAFDVSNDERLIMAGFSGILLSTDRGLTWTQRNQGLPEAFLPTFTRSANALYGLSIDRPGLYRRDATAGAWQPSAASPKDVLLGPFDYAGAVAVSAVDESHLFFAAGSEFARSLDGGASWTRMGNLGSLAEKLVWDPANERVGYALTTSLGIVKTVDGGANWAQLGNAPIGVADLVIDRANPAILYMTSYQSSGQVAWKSTDGGESWNPAGAPITGNGGSLVFRPGSSSVLYVAGSTALFKSTNAGNDWTTLAMPANRHANVLAVDPAAPDHLYALDGGFPGAVLRSIDGGTTWENLAYPNDFGSASDSRAVATVPGSPGLVALSRTDSGLFEFQVAPDLQLTATGSQQTAGNASSVVFTVANAGGYAATSARLSSELPPATGSYTVQGTGCAVNGRQLVCDLGIVRAAGTASVTVGFTPTAAASWQASVASYEPDSSSANNSLTLAVVNAPPTPPPTQPRRGGGGRLDYLLLALLALSVSLAKSKPLLIRRPFNSFFFKKRRDGVFRRGR